MCGPGCLCEVPPVCIALGIMLYVLVLSNVMKHSSIPLDKRDPSKTKYAYFPAQSLLLVVYAGVSMDVAAYSSEQCEPLSLAREADDYSASQQRPCVFDNALAAIASALSTQTKGGGCKGGVVVSPSSVTRLVGASSSSTERQQPQDSPEVFPPEVRRNICCFF